MRQRLTDKAIEGLKPTATGRYLVYDTVVPDLAVRVSRRKTFVLVTRFNGQHPTRRSLGAVGKLSLDDARDKARDWHRQLSRGIDPKRPRTQAFGVVRDLFLHHIRNQRRVDVVNRILVRELPHWSQRQLSEVSKTDVIMAIEQVVARGTPCAAHHLLAHLRRVFNFAIARDLIEHSPCDRIRPKLLIGPRVVRQRVLNDDELRSLWRASEQTEYPYGPLWQYLLLTGARKAEVTGARWTEFDFDKALWAIPAERFKSNATHMVPLSPMAIDLLSKLPRNGAYLFSMTGATPLKGLPKAKKRLDKLMGDVRPFMIHDLRRTVRTRLSALRVPDHIAEMAIGHGRKGIARVYDQHHYLPEMREALDAWADRLRTIVAA